MALPSHREHGASHWRLAPLQIDIRINKLRMRLP